jgi:hypothetical protein
MRNAECGMRNIEVHKVVFTLTCGACCFNVQNLPCSKSVFVLVMQVIGAESLQQEVLF